jgi:hypothetical protein
MSRIGSVLLIYDIRLSFFCFPTPSSQHRVAKVYEPAP